ncbi:MAG: SusC/RagA family TonB-linked outer membrane protein, partial [Tannerella sp.]|nr:SusC/RagA family TonB-linked outer membrane protein [Tannerella sp.]
MKKQIKESRGNPELPDNGKNNPARLLIVKMVTILLLSLHFSPVFGRDSFSARTLISVKVGNVAMTEVFRRIEAKSDCVFLYEDAVENELQKIVSVDARRQKLSIVLEQLFEGTDLNYKVNGRQVIVYRDPARVILAQAEPEQAKIPVKGVITDNTGEPLTGVNIQVKGTTSGVISGIDGDFNIDIPDVNTVLVFSYVGFETQEIKVGSKKILNIMLKESVSEMEEIVVVGYSTQKKESVVGSIVQTTSKELMKSGNITDINQALTGRLPGVTTSVSTGEPGGYADGASATQIFIRGRNSWNNSAPLILVDGVERNMNNLEITEIASISVLKDASATAVFGVKGANGVILVTTKRGEDTKPQITFSYNSTALTISRLPDKLDSYDTRLLRNEDIERNVSRNETLWADYTPMEIVRRYRDRSVPEYEWVYPNVDWTKAMFKDVGWSNRAAMNISGGTNFVKYFGNASYLHESDMFKEYNNNKGYKPSYGFDRFNFRTNFDFSLTQTTLLKVNLSGFFSQKNTTNGYNNTTSNNSPMIWAAAYRMPSDVFPIQYPDGAWGGANGFP